MYWSEVEYIFGDETVQSVIVDINGEPYVIFAHYKDGYISLIDGIKNLFGFLETGDVNLRFKCLEDKGEESDVEIESVITKYFTKPHEIATKKYTYRFHYRGWVDIEVEAENEEKAYIKADNKYCEGDYIEDPENFENTHTKLIKIE